MAIGASAGFSGVTIPQLKMSPNVTIEDGEFRLTDEQISWFGKLKKLVCKYRVFV